MQTVIANVLHIQDMVAFSTYIGVLIFTGSEYYLLNVHFQVFLQMSEKLQLLCCMFPHIFIISTSVPHW